MRNRRILLVAVVLSLVSFLPAQNNNLSDQDVEKRVDSILGKMTLEEKIDLIGGVNTFFIRAIPRVGLPELKMSDGPLGVHDYGPTTAYAAGIALAASWDTDLARRVGEMMGKDARARGVHFILAPGMNIYRAPMNGRNFEYFGEDPYLAGRMAVGLINGIQSQGVIATAKHYTANNSEFARMTINSEIDERTLREIYLPAFEASVREAHVGAIMDAYNLVNGEHMTQNSYLNSQVVKKDWGFKGIIMSDWDATHDAIAAANGGLDLEMPSGKYMNRENLLPAIKEGKVSEATIDEKVRRILRTAVKFGFYDRDQTVSDIPLYNQQGRELVRQEAREGMVLLKNTGNILPLDKTKIKTVAVIGPNAHPAVIGGGGSSLTEPFNAISSMEGISNYLGRQVKVLYAQDNPALDKFFEQTEFVTAPGGEPGLKAEYFNNQELQGSPALTRVDRHVNFQWGDDSYAAGQPADHFSVRWTGYYIPKDSGYYRFYTNSDDGVRLYLNDERVIDDWNHQAEKVNFYTAHLEQGKPYAIKLEYFEAVGQATASFGVANLAETIGKEGEALAKQADAVILCVGFGPTTESEGFDRTFDLPAGQDELIRRISGVNKNTVVVLNAGGNVNMNAWLNSVPALIQEWYPGEEGGAALAQILFGEYSPSGKLPATFEKRWEENPTYNSYYPPKGSDTVKYSEGVFVGYRGYEKAGVKPQFPFGFGLSYTTFKYGNLKVEKANGRVLVSFDVQNTGKRAGAEVAEVYVTDSHSSVPRPPKELKGFARVELRPGEKKSVTVGLDRRSFAYYDVAGKDWKVEPGTFGVLVGSSSEQIELKGNVGLTAQDAATLADPYAK